MVDICVYVYDASVLLLTSRRIPMSDVPTHSDEELEQFLYKLYEEKVHLNPCTCTCKTCITL